MKRGPSVSDDCKNVTQIQDVYCIVPWSYGRGNGCLMCTKKSTFVYSKKIEYGILLDQSSSTGFYAMVLLLSI